MTLQTGASKHFAYIEMASDSVAEIVAETMDNYLLMGHLLQCKVIPPDDVHPQLWVGANRKFKKIPRARVEKMKHEKVSLTPLPPIYGSSKTDMLLWHRNERKSSRKRRMASC